MQINLTLSCDMFAPLYIHFLDDYSHRWELLMGSAGSGKSYHIVCKLIIRACKEKINILVCRRFGTTIRNSVFALFKKILDDWKILTYIKINETDFRITFPNGSQILFVGLDDENKLLSLTDIGTIFVEEAYECSQDIIEQLNLRMRGHNEQQQIILAWNPISENHWLKSFCDNPPANTLYLHSTYKDNPFLSAEYIKTLEELYKRNPQKARVYCDGEWGINTEGLVFHNWEIRTLDEIALAKVYEHRIGCDLGFVDPSTIIDSYWDKKTSTIYVVNDFCKSGQTLDELYQQINAMGLSKSLCYFDSAEPRSIDFFRRKGINAKPCIKGQNSVQARITFLQNQKIIIDPKCRDLIKDLSNFSFEKNRTTGKYMDDKYTHEYSHTIDGLSYAYSDIYTHGTLRTLDKSLLGI